MSCKIVVAVLLCLVAVATSSRSIELPATAYIDTTDVSEYRKPSYVFLKDLVETYGSDEPEETKWMLDEVGKVLSRLIWDVPNEDRFHIMSRLDYKGYKSLSDIVIRINKLVEAPWSQCNRVNLDTFLGAIKLFFGDDLKAFANEKPTHDTKLHAFLLHYLKFISSAIVDDALKVKITDGFIERSVEKVIAYDLKWDHTTAELISKAQSMNLEVDTFDAKSMLKQVENYRGKVYDDTKTWRLHTNLRQICADFSALYGREIEIYIWTRLVAPENIQGSSSPSEDFLKLTEYWRVCLPINNFYKFDSVRANIERNTPTVGTKIGKSLKNLINKANCINNC